MNAETYEHKGVTVEINYEEFDTGHANPRDHDGNLSTFYIYRPGYELGEEQLAASGLPEIECPNCADDTQDECPRCEGFATVEPTLAEWAKSEDAIAIAPLFIYEHSGLSISHGPIVFLDEDEGANVNTDPRGRFMGDDAGWDTSFSGFALVTRANWKECFLDAPVDKEQIAKNIDSEVEEYDKYLRGEVFWFIVARDTPFEDSCHGFLGDDYIKEEANRAAECAADQFANEARERADWAARGVMTVD